jgi:hypothetical protein
VTPNTPVAANPLANVYDLGRRVYGTNSVPPPTGTDYLDHDPFILVSLTHQFIDFGRKPVGAKASIVLPTGGGGKRKKSIRPIWDAVTYDALQEKIKETVSSAVKPAKEARSGVVKDVDVLKGFSELKQEILKRQKSLQALQESLKDIRGVFRTFVELCTAESNAHHVAFGEASILEKEEILCSALLSVFVSADSVLEIRSDDIAESFAELNDDDVVFEAVGHDDKVEHQAVLSLIKSIKDSLDPERLRILKDILENE